MAGTIYYRERRTVPDGSKKPRYRVVAVTGADVKFSAPHLRLSELKHIAKGVGATLEMLPRGPKHQAEAGEA